MSVETYLGENILPTMMKLDDEDFLAAVEITLDYEDSRPGVSLLNHPPDLGFIESVGHSHGQRQAQ